MRLRTRFRSRLSLSTAQLVIDAAAAAATAKTASDDAAIAAKAATEAVANLATVQTGATSAALAKEAADYAAKAMAAYADAKKASEDAAAAEDVTAAVEARLLAELATVDAVSYSMTAVEKGTAAEDCRERRADDRWHGQDRRRYVSRCRGRGQQRGDHGDGATGDGHRPVGLRVTSPCTTRPGDLEGRAAVHSSAEPA